MVSCAISSNNISSGSLKLLAPATTIITTIGRKAAGASSKSQRVTRNKSLEQAVPFFSDCCC